jgi:hypothetical protein
MNREMSNDHTDRTVQLELLVAGELDEHQRRTVINWLEEDPRRWRMCGLLFLEAQTWSQSLAGWSFEVAERRTSQCHQIASARSPLPPRDRRRVRDAAVLAASVLVSFILGLALRHTAGNAAPDAMVSQQRATEHPDNTQTKVALRSPQTPILATMSMASGIGGLTQSVMQVPLVRGNRPPSEARTSSESISDYVRQQWQRRGYQLDVERRYLFATLPDGEQVAVPVEQYSIKRIPQKIN